MATAEGVARALSNAAGVHEFVVGERRSDRVLLRAGAISQQTRAESVEIESTLYVDLKRGRGQSSFAVTDGVDLSAQIQNAARQAQSALGPSWRLAPPAAPARVQVSDEQWQGPATEIARESLSLLSKHASKGMTILDATLEFTRTDTRTRLSNGFDNGFRSTMMNIEATVQAPFGEAVRIHMRARQGADLAWQEVLDDARRRSQDAAKATPVPPGLCDLLLLGNAYLPTGDDDFGIWSPLVHQCSAELARGGLARYQIGQKILKETKRDPLTMRSDGTLNFGLRSAPFADDGQAVRRFAMVDKGVAAGHAINHRDAALDSIAANGGVRNLIIDAGSAGLEELSKPGLRPLLVVESLANLQTHARGRLLMHVESARLHPQGGASSAPIRSATFSGNIFDWLESAALAQEIGDYRWCRAPKGIRFDGLRVH